jgi:uncharacterized membrane protein YfcA
VTRLRSPSFRIRLAVVFLVASLVGWPLSALTVARQEPQFVLGLSWLAIVLTALGVLATTDVRREQERDES